MRAVRQAVGDSIELLVDANTAYSIDDVRRVMPAYEEAGIGWLEEPFPPQDRRAYKVAASLGRVPLAAGENHYTRYEFAPLLEDGHVQFVQPDLSKTGGVTEAMRIAAMAGAEADGQPAHVGDRREHGDDDQPLRGHRQPGYFEGDVTAQPVPRPARRRLRARCRRLRAAARRHRHGLEIDHDFIAEHPLIEGPCYV